VAFYPDVELVEK